MNSCETCKHAKITYGEHVIKMDGITIKQSGGINCTCRLTTGIKNISFNDGGNMVCSSYEQGKAAESKGDSTVTICNKTIGTLNL